MRTFEITEQDALDYASETVSLAEDHGGPEKAAQLDWSYRVKKDLGEARKLKWLSEAEQKEFESAQRQKYDDLDAFIRGRRAR